MWPLPQSLKQLRDFLGLTGYYRKFVKNYGTISKPLTELLKKDSFTWANEAKEVFQEVKKAMTSAPVLALPDMTKTFVIETDASNKGIRVVLMKKGHPITFISKGLSQIQQVLSVYEKELLAIKKWHFYLIDQHFVIKTDHRSLK